MCSLNIQNFGKGYKLGDPGYRVNTWVSAARSGTCSTFLTCGQHSSSRKKLQTLSLGACGLKDKSKAFIPCSPHPAAAMWPVHRSSAFPAVAPGIQKYRLLWDRSILSWMDSINCCMETPQANSLSLSCPDMSEFSPGKLIMDLPRCLRITSHVQVSLLRSFSISVFWSFYRFFFPWDRWRP